MERMSDANPFNGIRNLVSFRGIGLAWVRNDMSEKGSLFTIRLANGEDVQATVLDHAAYDPEGTRLKS